MPFLQAGQLARQTPTARPDDPLGLVAENLRESYYDAIPVIDRGWIEEDEDGRVSVSPGGQPRVLGIVDERDLSRAAMPVFQPDVQPARVLAATIPFAANCAATDAASTNGHTDNGQASNGLGANGHMPAPSADGLALNGLAAPYPVNQATTELAAEAAEQAVPRAVTQMTAREVMRDSGFVPAAFSLHNALLTLDRYDCSALPVMDGDGRYRGMISRADVVAALGQQVRPPVVGGMATPLGVWLTTGNLSAGAPLLGLFLSGVVLACCYMFSHLVLLVGLSALNPQWGAFYASGRLASNAGVPLALSLLVTLAQYGVFFGAMRLLPMSGIHAAEHQTVWAIERGLPLTPEIVGKMPRAHPRCGTNLVALLGLIAITFEHLPLADPAVAPDLALLSLVFIFFFWRNFGTVIQVRFTTRPATRKQLESGIRAGQMLLEKYQQQPHVMSSFGSRLLHSGLAPAAAGMMLTTTVLWWLYDLLLPRLLVLR